VETITRPRTIDIAFRRRVARFKELLPIASGLRWPVEGLSNALSFRG
jgi:ABC-type uncharacterized transport system ATPase subunit